jgi:hypothetical protein
MTLTRFANRLPSADLRDAAKRRLVRVHIQLSAFDEVHTAAAEVEDKVVRDGHNRVSLTAHPLARAWFDERVATIRHVLVRQHVWDRTATLLGSAERRPTLSVLPELSLRGALWAELDAVMSGSSGASGAQRRIGQRRASRPRSVRDREVTADGPASR